LKESPIEGIGGPSAVAKAMVGQKAHPAFSVNIYAQASIKRPKGISSSHLYMSNIERTVFFAKRHFLLTLTANGASSVFAALRRFLSVFRLSRGERPWAVMTEDRLARVEGCRMLQFTLSDILALINLPMREPILSAIDRRGPIALQMSQR